MTQLRIAGGAAVIAAALALALVAGAGGDGAGLEAAPDSPAPSRGLTLQHATLVVSDFEESMAFYQGVLGLERIDAPFLPDRQVFLALGEGLELHVGEVPGVEIRPSGFNHFAVTPEDFVAFLDHLRANGIVYSNLGGGEDFHVQLRGDGVRQTFLQDPDGYWIEVNDFPGSPDR